MVSTSCIPVGTFYLSTLPLSLNAIARKVAAEFALISPSQTLQIPAVSQSPSAHAQHLLCHALTCLWASTHPAPRCEKGNPLGFISLVIPVSKTEWQHVEN